MLEAIQKRISEYEKQVDGTFTDKIFNCKIAELKWVVSLMNTDKQMEDGAKYLSTKFTQKEMSRIGAMCIGTSIGIDMVSEYVKYRISIKKPLKTTRPLIAMIKKLIDAEIKGYDIKQILDIVYDNEWQSFELDWIDKKLPKQQAGSGLSEFGFNPVQNNTQGLLK